MEYEYPWAPTAAHLRSRAMAEYVAGEALCDQPGRLEEGMVRLRRGMAMAWELNLEVWPGWATTMYERLIAGGVLFVDAPVPVLGADTASVQPAIAAAAQSGKAGAWWKPMPVLQAVSRSLLGRHFVVLDAFLPQDTLRALRQCCLQAWKDGLLQPAKVARPGDGYTGEQSIRTRSDCMAWIDPEAPGWAPLSEHVHSAEELVRSLLRVDERLFPSGIATRMRPMVARYGRHAGFARHTDNHCHQGQGPHCNGRVLTAVLYLQEDWSPRDGGCNRIFRPQLDFSPEDDAGRCGASGMHRMTPVGEGGEDESHIGQDGAHKTYQEEEKLPVTAGDIVMDVAPLPNRLLLFQSDFRCPHEVLEVHADERYAVTIWFMGQDRILSAAKSEV